ncbi:MAG: zinc ribbon domain-containing protein [Thermodesulfobacteriota bacterium]
MAKTTQKVKARKFVEDFLSGMSRDELMIAHSLTQGSFEKLLEILAQKGILTQDQIEEFGHPRVVRRAEKLQETVPPRASRTRPEERPERENVCPQCGAEVSRKALTCPECGHLLPGAQRWGADEGDKSFVRRVPAWVVGCLVAIPAALGVLYVFMFIIYPMMEVAGERKAQNTREQRRALKVSRQLANTAPVSEAQKRRQEEEELRTNQAALREEIAKLVERRVLAGAGENYRMFQAGSAWSELREPDKFIELNNIRLSMQRAKIEVDFEVKDLWGSTVARVTEDGVILGSPSEAAPPAKDPDFAGPEPARRGPGKRLKVLEEALK